MVDDTKDVLKFVLLLEDHKDVLSKSQTSSNKKKKEEAADLIISKWVDISKSQLTQASLFKKINNLKTRAKSALKCGKKVNEWQAKLLQIIVSSLSHMRYKICFKNIIKFLSKMTTAKMVMISNPMKLILTRGEWMMRYQPLQKLMHSKF